jgi:hypothetical protein
VSVKRILVGASVIGAMSLPTSWLAAGIANADPAPEPVVSASGEPLPVDPATQPQQNQNQNQKPAPPAKSGGNGGGFQLPQGLSNQLNQAAANLPSPVSVSVPVGVGLPDIGLPGFGLSIPLVLGGASALPSVSVPSLPKLPNPLNLPAPPKLPF